MTEPKLSDHFKSRRPSAIRMAQIEFSKRTDNIEVVNTAIGNVSLPMHPAMQKRMFNLKTLNSPFKNGVVKYTSTKGINECNEAFLNIIASSGFETKNLFSQITDGGSQAMELVIIGTCGSAGTNDGPLLLIDAAYTNYSSLAERVGRKTVSITRTLNTSGNFSFPDISKIEETIIRNKPKSLVVIPYDNPTGQFISNETMLTLGKLCVKHNLWMISDEAYRELYYTDENPSSIWALTEKDVPGITGRRISIETSSKVWNACGLRIGALVTDNENFHIKSVFENTANLCSNAIGQYIFSALKDESHTSLNDWYKGQREYYFNMLNKLKNSFSKLMPELIVSNPQASLYSVVDVSNIKKDNFDANKFVAYCAQTGKVDISGKPYTLLTAPMEGFYNTEIPNPGRNQMRIAFVETPEKMALVPELFKKLFNDFVSL